MSKLQRLADLGQAIWLDYIRLSLLTSGTGPEAGVPDEAGEPASSITFGVLETWQALRDDQGLKESGRKVMRFHLGTNVVEGLTQLTEELA